MGLLKDDKEDKKEQKAGVGDTVLLGAEGLEPAPAVVLRVNEDGTLKVRDLSDQYGVLHNVSGEGADVGPGVLTWAARGGK